VSLPIGLAPGIVEIHPYSVEWPRLFAEERAAIARAVGAAVLAIEHIGSTSVPALPSKPIIDIAVAVTSFEAALDLVDAFAALGYEHRGEFGIPRRRYFTKGTPRTHHVHMLEIDSDEWREHLRFRDHLRANPEDARQYAELKRGLASRFRDDRHAYTEAKGLFIRSILRRAFGATAPTGLR
jgi:GrpB-like predicted nucleotidyltransferase (UPF0157 family)